MSPLSPLEQELARQFILESRLQAPSGLHRRFLGKRAGQPQSGSLLISCATYPPLPDDSVELQHQLAAKMKSPQSPSLTAVRDFSFDSEFHWMAAEMPAIPDLRSCLRVHQQLSVEAVGWLLGVLSEALQGAVAQGWPRFSMHASQVLVDLENRRARLLIPDMPLFGFSTLTLGDSMHTMAFNPAAFTAQETQVPDSTRDYVTPLAALCCEALGAATATGGGQNERFRAIPVLTTHQNTLLRTALAGAQRHSFENLEEFVSQFLSAGEASSTHHSHHTHRTTTTPVTAAAPVAPVTAPAPPPPPAPPVSYKDVLPAGYQMESELRSMDNWRLCRAKHHSYGEVLITTLDVSAELGESQRRLAEILQSLQSPHTALLKPLEVQGDRNSLHIIRSLPSGRTLLDALREHRSFSRPTVARLLASIHAAYEALWALVPGRFMATALDQFWVPQSNGDNDEKNRLRLDVSQLVIESFKNAPGSSIHPVNHFARLTLSLLGQDGGLLSGAGPSRFTPVPELSSEVNGVLRRALAPDATGELTLPWLLSQVTAALAGHTAVAHASRHVMQVPEALRDLPLKTAKRLRLQPREANCPIIALVADETFWLGRAATHSDFVAQFRPRSPVNDNRSKCISRSQMRAFLRNGQVHLKDQGSSNPSFSAGRRLGDSEIVQLPITVVLAGEYPLDIRALKSAYPAPGPAVSGWATAGPRPMRRGACSFQAIERGILQFEAAWIFTDVSLIMDVSGRLTFDDASPKSCLARFHHHAGAFWVEAPASARLLLNGQALQEGEVAPLGVGDEICIGNEAFSIAGYDLESTAS